MDVNSFMIELLNMSFAGSVAAVIVWMARVLLRRFPKGYSYILWIFVLFRLLCPFVLPFPVHDFFPANARPISQDIIYEPVPQIDTGLYYMNQTLNPVLADNFAAKRQENSINPIQVVLYIGAVIWLIGFLAVMGCQLYKYIRLRKRVRTALQMEKGIYVTEEVSMPFVAGIMKPCIYLPSFLEEEKRKMVLEHEKIHLKRGDYIVKFLWFLALSFHWFNPIVWAAFASMCKDMEMSCDELVVREAGVERRKEYSLVLLYFAEDKGRNRGNLPLAFGENHIKSRIKNILRSQRPALWRIVIASVVLLVVGIMILTGSEGGSIGARFERKAEEAWNLAVPIEMENLRKETWGTNVELEYASEQRIVIRGYFGLIVCDNTGGKVKKNDHWKITHTLDLPAIGVRDMQGDGYAEMYVGKERAVISPAAYLTAAVVPENPIAYIYTFSSDSKEDDLVRISEGISEQIMAVISETEPEETEPGEYHSLYQNVYEIVSEKIREEYKTGMIGDMRPLQETESQRWGFLAADGDKVEDIWYGIYDAKTGEIIRVLLF